MNTLPITLEDEPDPEPPSDGEILGTLCQCFDAEPDEVLGWLRDFKPNAALSEYQRDLGIAK